LLRGKLTDGGQHTERVTSQHDDVARLAVDGARNLGVGDELDGVCAAGVLGDAHVVVIRDTTTRVVDDVLEDGAVPDSVEDFGLLFGGEVDALGIAASFDVEDTSIRPDMLVVANEETVRVSREGSLSRARKTEEECHITGFHSDVGRGVERELAEFDGLKVMLQLQLATYLPHIGYK